MEALQNLSEQLDPLETAYADVRFFDVDVEQTQQEYETLMSQMNNEMEEERALSDQEQQLKQEAERLDNVLSARPNAEQLDEVIFLCVFGIFSTTPSFVSGQAFDNPTFFHTWLFEAGKLLPIFTHGLKSTDPPLTRFIILPRFKFILWSKTKEHSVFQILQHQLPALEAQLEALLDKDTRYATETRKFVKRRMEEEKVSEMLRKLRDAVQNEREALAEEERQRKAAELKDEIVKLSLTVPNEQQILQLEEQLQQLPLEYEETKALVHEMQSIRAKKEQHEALQQQLADRLAGIADQVAAVEKSVRDANLPKGDKAKPTREQLISALTNAISETEKNVLPEIEDLSRLSQEQHVELTTLDSERERVNQLFQDAKVNSSKTFCI